MVPDREQIFLELGGCGAEPFAVAGARQLSGLGAKEGSFFTEEEDNEEEDKMASLAIASLHGGSWRNVGDSVSPRQVHGSSAGAVAGLGAEPAASHFFKDEVNEEKENFS